MNKLLIYFLLFTIGLAQSCSKDDDDTEPDLTYTFVKPENFPEPTYTFDNNPVTQEGFELGRRIFFDPLLSIDNSVSCGNCHNQAVAFSDPQHTLSIGVDGKVGIRNAPALANMAFMDEFFWDGGVTHLDFVPLNAIEADFEMGEEIANVIDKLNNHSEYPQLFKEAFDVDTINTPRLLHALSQYTAMMVSATSRYDKYIRNEGEELTEDELAGLQLFETKCSSCHEGALFTDQSYRNNGLDETFDDRGRATITELESDEGKFKVPSLRNVAITDPYMHDGRFFTLEQVLNHYSEGVWESATLDEELRGDQLGIPLTETEKAQIIAFLNTLTDTDFTRDPKFINPR
ncbi:MAG: cytochrome-c peroxidase [bacterium]|nr:cytochrome-c peroxidase [bacterium]